MAVGDGMDADMDGECSKQQAASSSSNNTIIISSSSNTISSSSNSSNAISSPTQPSGLLEDIALRDAAALENAFYGRSPTRAKTEQGTSSFKTKLQTATPQTPNPKPQTPNPKPQNPNLLVQTLRARAHWSRCLRGRRAA